MSAETIILMTHTGRSYDLQLYDPVALRLSLASDPFQQYNRTLKPFEPIPLSGQNSLASDPHKNSWPP